MRTINRLCGGALTLARVISQKILVAALLSLFISRSSFALPLYTAIDLGTLGGTTSIAYGVNNIGQVVGQADTLGNATSNAFIYSNDVGMKDLDVLGRNINPLAC